MRRFTRRMVQPVGLGGRRSTRGAGRASGIRVINQAGGRSDHLRRPYTFEPGVQHHGQRDPRQPGASPQSAPPPAGA